MILDKTEKQITVNNKASRTKSKGNGNSVKKKNSKRTNMSAKTSAAKKPAAKKPAQKSKRSSKYKTAGC